MKFLLVFTITLVIALADGRPDGAKYTTKYDNVDLDEILSNERLFKNYFDCIMDKGRCTPDGQELRNSIADALETGCEKCSEKQTEGARKVLRYVYDKKKDYFEQLKEKYDPNGKYIDKYREDAKKEGVDLKK